MSKWIALGMLLALVSFILACGSAAEPEPTCGPACRGADGGSHGDSHRGANRNGSGDGGRQIRRVGDDGCRPGP